MFKHILLAMAILGGAAWAQESLKHADAEIEITVPAGWTYEAEEDLLIVSNAAEEISIFFLLVDAESMDKALEALDDEVAEIVENLKTTGKAEKLTINGMNAVYVDFQGEVEDTQVLGTAMVCDTPSDKLLLVFGLCETEAFRENKDDILAIFKSIKAAAE